MHKKIRVALLFGGQSAEHEVSIQSAKNVYEALDKEKYDVQIVGIDKKGNWHALPDPKRLFSQKTTNNTLPALPTSTINTIVTTKQANISLQNIDVIFPLLHGPMGEDGTVQGFLKVLGIPFVGSGVLGSAVGMDKDVMKRLLRDAGLPIAKFHVYKKFEKVTAKEIEKAFSFPLFVKPANLGSSVGVTKAHNRQELEKAIKTALTFDTKIIVEEFIKAREIECAVLGNDDPKASIAGEIIPSHEFYDYDAKYIDPEGAKLKIPADISEETLREVQSLAIKTFKVLEARGLARVDFFLAESGKLYINEINTMPGFTQISMYPKLWEASGVSYKELISQLITLGID